MIYFLHIEKTGGQTLAQRLAHGFARDRVSVLETDITDPGMLADLAARCDFFEGHPLPGSLSERPPSLRMLTAVRDPVEQVISHYRHIRRSGVKQLCDAASALPAVAFFERFGDFLLNYQARKLVTAMRAPGVADLVRGMDAWLLRHLEQSLAALTWVLPSERLDEFCVLWALEQGRSPQGDPGWRVNGAPPEDGVDVPALRRWLHANLDRLAVDHVLWCAVRRRYEEWKHALLVCDAAGSPAPGTLAWSAHGAAIWLLRDWHPPARRDDGVLEWWTGPGAHALLRIRRAGHGLLRFEALTMLGVRWEGIEVRRCHDLMELPTERRFCGMTGIAQLQVDITGLAEEENVILSGLEDVTVLPALPLAWETPRRGFATQHWRLE
jgi:hypothetical protein